MCIIKHSEMAFPGLIGDFRCSPKVRIKDDVRVETFPVLCPSTHIRSFNFKI